MDILSIFKKAKIRYISKMMELIDRNIAGDLNQGATLMGLETSISEFEEIFMDEYHAAQPDGERGFALIGGFHGTMPKRSTKSSAGYDLFAAETVDIPAGETRVIPTGVKAYFPSDEVLYVFARSSVGIKRNLILPNGVGVIDSDYYNNPDNQGHIFVALHNIGKETQSIAMGDRIAQCVFTRYMTAGDEVNEERTGGIGSSGV